MYTAIINCDTILAGSPTAITTDKVDQCSKLLAQMTQSAEAWAKTLRSLSSAPDEDRRIMIDEETQTSVGVVDGQNNKSDSEENTGMFCTPISNPSIYGPLMQHSVAMPIY